VAARAAPGPTSRRCPAATRSARSAPSIAFRNLVERFFSKLKHFRAVATRFEKRSENDIALVKLASAKIRMRLASR
jgi:transposase